MKRVCTLAATLLCLLTACRPDMPNELGVEVARIVIGNEYAIAMGEVTDRDEIDRLVELLRIAPAIPQSEFSARAVANHARTLTLAFTDGTASTFTLYGDVATWEDQYLALPEGTAAELESELRYRGWQLYVDAGFDYGNRCADNFDDILSGDGRRMHVSVRLEGNHIVADNWGGETFIFADDAAGDLHLEGFDLYYRALDGAIVRLRYDHPHMDGIPARLLVGENFFPILTDREVIDGGRYIRFQMRKGVRFTLTAEGTLARNGTPIADGVRDFCLDGEAVIWTTAQGVFRRLEGDGRMTRLSDADATAITTAGLDIYFATTEGKLHRVRCDGARLEPIAQLDAVDLEYVRLGPSGEDGLAILDRDGWAWVLTDGAKWSIDDGIAAIDECDGLWLIYENGHVRRALLELRDHHLTDGRHDRLRKAALD